MDLREEFCNQWKTIEKIVLSEAKRQVASGGAVDVTVLTEILSEETCKWQHGILVQGLWYQQFANEKPNSVEPFNSAVKTLSVLKPKVNIMPYNWLISITIITITILLAICLYRYTDMDTVELIFYPILFLVASNTLCVPIKKSRRGKAIDTIMHDIKEQLDEMKDRLLEYV